MENNKKGTVYREPVHDSMVYCKGTVKLTVKFVTWVNSKQRFVFRNNLFVLQTVSFSTVKYSLNIKKKTFFFSFCNMNIFYCHFC